jgi:hypothetical protein
VESEGATDEAVFRITYVKRKVKEKKLKRLFLLQQFPLSFNVSVDSGKKSRVIFTLQYTLYSAGNTIFPAMYSAGNTVLY